jgi:SAM-dependent methyltransferase
MHLSHSRRAVQLLSALCFVFVGGIAAVAEEPPKPFMPVEGQAGKDVVWVPTPFTLVEKMLDMAKVTPQDFVMDLGSGDGRNIIAAAKRGAHGVGVEYNPEMVELSRRTAEKEGVADKATFVQGDMYEADISRATVLALFLLPENLDRLKPKFLALRPGTRIVMNGFAIPDWSPDETQQADGDCGAWCTSLLYIVPAKVAGTWRLPAGELTLDQKFQTVSGTLTAGGTRTPIANVRLRGDRISFTAGGVNYVGRVNGDAMSGKTKGSAAGAWTAVRGGAKPKVEIGA